MAADEELDAEERYQQSLEHEIESITFAGGPSAKLDTVDGRLMGLLSVRAYDAIVQKSQTIATKRYRQHFESELSGLLENRRIVAQEFGTAGDAQDSWRVNPLELRQSELRIQVRRLARKLQTVEQEIVELTEATQQKAERLGLVRAQNERLALIRDARVNHTKRRRR
jgi:hypothetical protein